LGLHVIIGEDDYLVGETASRIVGDGVGLEVIDSATSSNAELQLADIREADASFSTPPFLEPKKVTWWKNVHFLPGGGGKKAAAEEVKAALEKLAEKLVAEELPENQEFILSGPGLLKTSVFAKTLASAAEIVQFAAEKPWEAARKATVRAIDFAAERGLKFAPGAAELFVSRVGNDTRSLLSEIDKMRDYLGDGADTITEADIAEISSQGVGLEPEVWTITDAFGERNLEKTLRAVAHFEGDSGFAIIVTNAIERFCRQMLDMAAGKAGAMNPYVMRKNQGYLRNWSRQELRVARWRFLELREKAISGSVSIDTLVVNAIVRTCRRSAR